MKDMMSNPQVMQEMQQMQAVMSNPNFIAKMQALRVRPPLSGRHSSLLAASVSPAYCCMRKRYYGCLNSSECSLRSAALKGSNTWPRRKQLKVHLWAPTVWLGLLYKSHKSRLIVLRLYPPCLVPAGRPGAEAHV